MIVEFGRLRTPNSLRVRKNMLANLSRLRTLNSLKLLEVHLVIITKQKVDTGGPDGFVTSVVNQVTLDLYVISY